MNADFESVKINLPSQPFAKDLVCFIVFGSSVVNYNMSKSPSE